MDHFGWASALLPLLLTTMMVMVMVMVMVVVGRMVLLVQTHAAADSLL